MILEKIKSVRQKTNFSCGPAALRTLFKYYGFSISEEELIKTGEIGTEGTDFRTMKELANHYNFSFSSKTNGTIEGLKKYISKKIPILVCLQAYGPNNGKNGHYVVITGITDKWIYVADSSNYWEGDGKKFAETKKMRIDIFMKRWWEIDSGKVFKNWYSVIKLKK